MNQFFFNKTSQQKAKMNQFTVLESRNRLSTTTEAEICLFMMMTSSSQWNWGSSVSLVVDPHSTPDSGKLRARAELSESIVQIRARVRYWEILLYQRFTGKWTGQNLLPVKVCKMQCFKIRAKIWWKLCQGGCGTSKQSPFQAMNVA